MTPSAPDREAPSAFEEIARAAYRIDPELDSAASGAFAPATVPDCADWRAWIAGCWFPMLEARFFEALECAREGRTRDLVIVDRVLDSVLGAAVDSSRAAGRRILARAGVPRGDRSHKRFLDRIERGAASGHLVCVCALRSALFHLPDQVAAGAYLYQEAYAALPARWIPDLPELIHEGLRGGGETGAGAALRRLA